MRSVYLEAAVSEIWNASSTLRISSPFLRRMTALQKAVVQSFAALEQDAPEAMRRARAVEAPLYYSSAYGELSAMLQVTRAIVDHDLPVSPKEFQHSVQNAALAYLAMTHEIHHPCYALSGGFLSADTCLQLAQQRVRSGLDAMAFVIHAHEYLDSASAQAEILLLSNVHTHADLQLDFCRFGTLADFEYPYPEIFVESDSKTAPWILNQGRPAPARLCRTLSGESLVTQWLSIP